jgi:hypothetical protein
LEPDRKTFQWSHTTPKSNNHKDVSYPTSDIGSSYDTDISFSVGVYDGLTQSTLTNKKDFIDENTPAVFYNMSIVTTFSYGGKTYTHTTDYTYDEPRRWTSPIATKVTKEESGNTNKYVVNTSQTYNDYGSITNAVDVMGVTTTYTYDATSHLLVGVSKPISATQTQYTEYVRDAVYGNVTTIRVREGNVTGAILQETITENYDAFGNALQTRVKKDAANYVTFQTEYKTTLAASFSGRHEVTSCLIRLPSSSHECLSC